ncbi:MAG: hypothetical protein H9917_07920 [Candidatus Oceanisphaera merdipullorum]|nr:hypothetical protein [Candidatus Oceanisphaera merdipullorum]
MNDMSKLVNGDDNTLVCAIINLTDIDLGVITGAEIVTDEALLAKPLHAYDIWIRVLNKVDDEQEWLALTHAVTYSGLKLLIYPSVLEVTVMAGMDYGYKGVIQCAPALTTALLNDLIEPLTRPALFGIDYQDLTSFFIENEGKVYYQRYALVDNQCPELVIPHSFKQQNTQLGLLLVLTLHQDSDFSLLQAVGQRVGEIKEGIQCVLGDRQAASAPEALGILWFE